MNSLGPEQKVGTCRIFAHSVVPEFGVLLRFRSSLYVGKTVKKLSVCPDLDCEISDLEGLKSPALIGSLWFYGDSKGT